MARRSISRKVEECRLEHEADNHSVFVDYFLDGAIVYCKDCSTLYLITEDTITKSITAIDLNKIANMLRISEVKRYLFSI